MERKVSVIIPAADERDRIGSAVDAAFAAGADEVIVADGGSTDGTAEEAAAHGARVLTCPRRRSRQLNEGAALARHPYLLFVHADTLLPQGSAAAVCDALDRGVLLGGFRIAFIEAAVRLRIAAFMINLRTGLTRCPWGDQAQFILRDLFLEGGGYADIELMEDYELAIRMKRRGRNALLPLTVRTSGRRFLRKGVLRTALTNWWIIIQYRMGKDPAALAALYRG